MFWLVKGGKRLKLEFDVLDKEHGCKKNKGVSREGVTNMHKRSTLCMKRYTVIHVILSALSETMPDFKMIVTFQHSQPLCVDNNRKIPADWQEKA
jgi:hypothetical protein